MIQPRGAINPRAIEPGPPSYARPGKPAALPPCTDPRCSLDRHPDGPHVAFIDDELVRWPNP